MARSALVTDNTRDRLLIAAAELLEEAHDGAVSTRAICDRAGVQAPSLYHHFGSRDGLLDAVLTHGFGTFLTCRTPAGDDDDPIEAIRHGWDLHVQFGLENPNFYMLIYGRARPGEPCSVVAEVERMILAALRPAARQRRLRIAPEEAARQIVAASTGVVLTLITKPADEIDLALSDQVRDAILDMVATAPRERQPADADTVSSAAIALTAMLDDAPQTLSTGEASLMREWLRRLSAPSRTR